VIGYWRYLFVNLIPPEHKTAYISLNMANIGLFTGIAPLLAARILQWTQNLSGSFGPFHVDPYTPLFLACLVGLVVGVYLFAGLPDAGAIPVKRVASFFFQGSPAAAMQALIAYHFAGEETKRLSTVRRLAEARSPLGNAELIKSLSDPSFNVRHEAILSIANAHRDEQLTEALIDTLRRAQPELRASAAWALGRIGDLRAMPVLLETLRSPYPSLRAWSARALGMLGDRAAAPELILLFRSETDPAIRAACASALACLDQIEVIPDLLRFLHDAREADLRSEISLAIATLLGRSEQALRLWRRMHDQPGDTLAGVMLALRRRLVQPRVCGADLSGTIERCGQALGVEDFPTALPHLRAVTDSVHLDAYSPAARLILPATRQALERFAHERREYILLAVHTLHVGLLPEPRS
jgi:HEAT repeat protein